MAEEQSSVCRSVRRYFREYCACTSIHGFKYFGEKRTIFERIWWLFVFGACLAVCALSISAVYKKWERSPIIVTFATRETSIFRIPFPAVTICPESKSTQVNFNFTNIMHKKQDNVSLTDEELTKFEYMSLICNYYPNLDYMNNETFPNEFFDVVESVKPEFKMWECRYMGQEIDCRTSFIPIITDEGICYTFNMLDRTELFRDQVVHYSNFHTTPQRATSWSLEHGYDREAGVGSYPRRALLAGASNSLSLKILTTKDDNDYACKNALQGHRVLLHIPARLPRPSEEYFRIPLNQEVVGAVQPVLIQTSDSVKMYHPSKRECYFPTERYLKYFKIYTQLNCMMECLTNFTLHNCGCVKFFMPRENGTKICGTGSIKCMEDAERDLQVDELHVKLDEETARNRGIGEDQCDCMPICTDLSYNVETSQIDWDWVEQMKAHRIEVANFSEYHLSSLTIFFKSNQFIASERNELYGPTDFLANFGGLLGLFTGFSVLSLMEIIYFLTVRVICNLRLYQNWAGSGR